MESETGVAPADAERQLAWLRRASEKAGPDAWRPPALHRAVARRWVLSLDHMLQVGTSHAGLVHFKYKPDCPLWQRWETWPGIGVSMDMGADGLAGMAALQYGFETNIWCWPDPSHACQRSFEGALKDCGVWQYWLLLLISWNLEHGPYSDRHRHNQLQESLKQLLENRSPQQVPLFLHLAPWMAKDLEVGGLATFPRDRPLEEELWEWLRERSKRRPLGRRVSTNRFGGTQHAALQHRPLWAVELFERTFLALELDFLSGQRFLDRLLVKTNKGTSLSEGGTDPRRLQVDDKALRSCCANAVTVSVFTLDDMGHRRVVDIVLVCQRPLDEYHIHQNRVLRDVPASRTWLLEQLCGGVGRHLKAFWQILQDISSLTDAGFSLPGYNSPAMSDAETCSDIQLETLVEDECADLCGAMILSHIFHRGSRLLYFSGWPTKMLAALEGSATATKVIGEFKADAEIWDEFVSSQGKCPLMKLIELRGSMRLMCVKQFREAFGSKGYAMSPELQQVLERRSSGNVQTQVVEDVNGVQKNSSFTTTGRRFRKASMSMAVALSQDILANRHRFTNVQLDTHSRTFDAHLSNDTFHPQRKHMSFDYSGIASYSQQAPWWSPSSGGWCVPHADIELLRQAKATGSMHRVSKCSLGEVCSSAHRMGIGFPDGAGRWHWFFCLKHLPKSAVMCWPAELRRIDNCKDAMVLEPNMEADGVALNGVWSLAPSHLRVVCYEWKSWLWQSHCLPREATQNMRPGIRAFVNKFGIQTMQEAGSREAWWGLSRSFLAELAGEFGIVFESGASLADLLWCMIQNSLATSDSETLDILHKRLARDSCNSDHCAALLEIEEAIEVCDHLDSRKVNQAKKEARSSLESRSIFKEAYVRRATQVHATAKAKASSGRRQSAATSRSTASSASSQRAFPAHHCSQQEAKALLPEGASIWRSLVRGEWCGHLPPHRRVTAPFARHVDSQGALAACLRQLWAQHLEKTGAPLTDCPISGLF